MLLSLEALGVDLVDVLRAGGSGCKPAVLGDDLDTADGSVVAGRAGQNGRDRLARELRGLDLGGRQARQHGLLFGRGRRVYAPVGWGAEPRREFVICNRGIVPALRC